MKKTNKQVFNYSFPQLFELVMKFYIASVGNMKNI